MGSLSPSSSDSQATGRPQPAAHAPARVVLPKPAEAEMRVSLRSAARPSVRRSISRWRGTYFGRGGGRYSLVARMDVGMYSLYGTANI